MCSFSLVSRFLGDFSPLCAAVVAQRVADVGVIAENRLRVRVRLFDGCPAESDERHIEQGIARPAPAGLLARPEDKRLCQARGKGSRTKEWHDGHPRAQMRCGGCASAL